MTCANSLNTAGTHLGRIVRGATLALALVVTGGLPAAAQTFSDAFAGFGSNEREPIQIEAKELQVQDKNQSAVFSGDVVVTQGDAVLKTQRLVVRYDGSAAGGVNQKIASLEASGRVYISSKDQTATGEHASFDMKRERMVMTGKQVVLSQGPNVVVGSRLTVNLKTGQADLEAPKSGRVKVLIQPNSAPRTQ
ncbi:MAG: lipopolysaccharide transport periplasmic protein LptA [Stappia sp.]|uniref:lipopolysaccharide transport periplasmic protein LptA n=1 Tax=Stappia sp. TaxID=1870903 RepID=UPI000C66F4B1|nr:lipopolysaccharide transport periplasmic protein LptA [Stappia sp.]MAA99345.1 lipopolysaccharide transport periplasmic protein LptA [Stappia sp.]MBM19311.1 lipopolysaccharide transport periplasmic protein LptA [Stappia sp.]